MVHPRGDLRKVHGYQKQGAAFGYPGSAATTRSWPRVETGERLRKGCLPTPSVGSCAFTDELIAGLGRA